MMEITSTELKNKADPACIFSTLLLDQINFPDVNAVLDSQHQIIKRLDVTNRNLTRVNQQSTETFNSFAVKDFQSYIALLGKMKTDLDYIFKHIRIVKNRLQTKYPEQFQKAFKEHHLNDEDDEELDDAESQSVIKESMNTGAVGTIPGTFQGKDRSLSNESGSSAKVLLANLIESARSRLSSMELVNGLVSGGATQSSRTSPTQVVSEIEKNKSPVEPQIESAQSENSEKPIEAHVHEEHEEVQENEGDESNFVNLTTSSEQNN